MKKRALTLIEIMIVILLISLIGGAIGYNVKGSFQKGKDFKTARARAQLEDIFEICIQEGINPQEIAKNPLRYLRESGLAKDPDQLMLDGNGNQFRVTYNQKTRRLVVQ